MNRSTELSPAMVGSRQQPGDGGEGCVSLFVVLNWSSGREDKWGGNTFLF